jgi:hypothetical protein
LCTKAKLLIYKEKSEVNRKENVTIKNLPEIESVPRGAYGLVEIERV